MSAQNPRAVMLANLWAKTIYPKAGDVSSLNIGILNHEDVETVIGVCGPPDLDLLIDALLSALVGERRQAPRWLAYVATMYFDDVPQAEAEAFVREHKHLGDNPTPTTKHGLMVMDVTDDGMTSTAWQVDLKEPIEIPEEPAFESMEDEPVVGHIAETLYATFLALSILGVE